MYRLGGRFGVGHVVDVLRGSQKERILELGHDRLSTYGIGADASVDHWRSLLQQLVHRGYLEQEMGQYPVLKLTPAALPVLRGEETLMLARPRVRVARDDGAGRGRKKRGRGARWRRSGGGQRGRRDAEGVELSGDDLAADDALFEELRALRRRDRRPGGGALPTSSSTTRPCARWRCARPATDEALLDIGGVGERKLEKYGAEFLALLTEWAGAGGE